MNTLQHFPSTLGCHESQPRVYLDEQDEHSPAWHDARNRTLRRLTRLDAGELATEPEVVAALKTGDEAEVGRVMLAKLNEWLDRVATIAEGA